MRTVLTRLLGMRALQLLLKVFDHFRATGILGHRLEPDDLLLQVVNTTNTLTPTAKDPPTLGTVEGFKK